MKFKILIIFGTRPEIIKLAPVIHEFKKHGKRAECKTVFTGQHMEMAKELFPIFDIEPDYNLNLMTKNQSLISLSSKCMVKLQKVFNKEKPDLIIVQGDTNTAFISALTAFYNKIKVAHVEAGLRTYNKFSPFPEEINRKLLSVVSDFNFVPTKLNKENLIKENYNKNKIYITGNTVIDSLNYIVKNKKLLKNKYKKRTILVTAHRRESFGKEFENICYALQDIARQIDVDIVYPVHLNPNVQKSVNKILSNINNIHLIKSLDYLSFTSLLKNSYLILTDSGGIQEEAPAFKKPVLVMRNTTERKEGIKNGVAKLIGTKRQSIVHETLKLLLNKNEYKKMQKSKNPYGDGKSSVRIVKNLLENLK